MKNLVFVESPTKAATLAKFLGGNYQIEATFGHIRDLPKGTFGIDIDKDFEPKYVIPKKVQKRVNQLIKIAKDARQFYLATDPDREGEAIAWHLKQLLEEKGKVKNGENFKRVVFHEITPEAVKEAFLKPREIDEELVDAWKARRILDRIVGYKLSPLLWAKIKKRLSAGRVQSVALRLICERAEEIDKFKPAEYWEVEALLKSKDARKPSEFTAKLVEKAGKKINLKNEIEAKKVVSELEKAEYKVDKISQKEVKKQPAPPFTTSTLQQAASAKFGFSAKRTMKLAQDLYERGLITYHRTDSVALAESALLAIRNYISKNLGKEFLPDVARKYRVRSKLAQEAHEAIRPTKIDVREFDVAAKGKPSLRQGDWVEAGHKKIYELIWQRAVASQVKGAILNKVSVDVLANNYLLRAADSTVKFDGFLIIYGKEDEEAANILPELSVGEVLDLIKLTPSQHFTEPPAAFTDGTLVKALEAYGIGRPSTYAPIISTLIERAYVERVDRKLVPTELGKTVNSFLVSNFANVVDYDFTAELEADLDDIAQNRQEWVLVIKNFYQPFEKHLEKVFQTAAKIGIKPEETSEVCPKCGRKMVVRFGKFGRFLACSGFPECKTTMSQVQKTDLTCPACGGNIVTKRTKKGRTFWGCSNYPKCTFASWTKPIQPAQTITQNDARTR